MVNENSPSSIMYADLKQWGLSNYDAALILLDADISFGKAALRDRINSRSQLSRSIVHVAPGEMNSSLFRDFSKSCQMLMSKIAKRAREKYGNDINLGICEHYSGPAAQNMQAALKAYGIDSNVYRNAVSYIAQYDFSSESDRALSHLLLFIATGCTGNPSMAVDELERFSASRALATFQTPIAQFGDYPPVEFEMDDYDIGLIRIVNGKLKGSSSFYRVNPTDEGTEIGSLASTPHAITDVDADVSRHHARIFKHGKSFYIVGLNSTNGTTVISGEDKREHVVEPPKRERSRGYVPQPFEIFPADAICLGVSTRFMVVPFANE